MIDREARNRLLQGIDDYMDEKISAAEFNTLLHQKIVPNTKDELIKEVSFWLFDSDEDVGTNRLQSVCPYWKYFNRIRLLLASDAEYQYVYSKQRLTLLQWIGGVSVALFLVLAVASLWTQPWSWDFFPSRKNRSKKFCLRSILLSPLPIFWQCDGLFHSF